MLVTVGAIRVRKAVLQEFKTHLICDNSKTVRSSDSVL